MKTSIAILASVAFAAPAFADSPFASFREGYSDQKVAASIGETVSNTADKVVDTLVPSDDLPPMLSKGTREFGVNGFYNWAEDDTYALNLSYGWFIRDRWEVGLAAGLQGVESDLNFSLGLFTEYNFCFDPTSKWVPFIGFSASWARLDSDAFDSDSIALGLDLGVKYFIRENIAISFSIGADYAFDDVFPGEDDFAKQLNIGTRFYF